YSSGQSKSNSQQANSGAALNRRNTPQQLRTSAQSNMMSDLSAALNRRRNNGEEATNSSPVNAPANIPSSSATPSSLSSLQATGFKFDKQKASTLDRTPK
ncbi:hypothetical protein, partial [Salmonella sp. s51228]|uniref:hypothetical protein n=1 Tax=Salmonella sp. s51228 TaxID=3159652 RepID=UPI00397EA419